MNFQQCNYGTTYQLTENPHHKTQLARMVTLREQHAQQAVHVVWAFTEACCGHRACDQRPFLVVFTSFYLTPSRKSRSCFTKSWPSCRTAR